MIPAEVEIAQHLDGVVCVGVAQEEAMAWTATKQVRGRHMHFSCRWRTDCVNHYYLYVIDPEEGAAFLKVCDYAPNAMEYCLNGHECAKRQARRYRVALTALDNGFLARTETTPQRLLRLRGRRGAEQLHLPPDARATHQRPPLLHAERTAHDCRLGNPQFAALMLPGQIPAGQPAPSLEFGRFRIMALAAALRFFGLTPDGITNPQLRPRAALVLGLPEGECTLG